MTIKCPTSPYDKKTDVYAEKTSPYTDKTNIFLKKTNPYITKDNKYDPLYFCPVLLQENSYPLLLENGLMIEL